MTTTLIAPKTSGSNFAPAPAGLQVARCIAMVDLGTHEETGKFGTKRQRKLRLSFELPEELAVFNEEKGEQPYIVSREFTFTMASKGNLRAFLEGWRGAKFTDPEADAFDVAKLLGVPVYLNIIHADGKMGKVYANIATASKLPKKVNCPEQVTPSTIFSLTGPFDQDVFDALPEWIRTKIAQSYEYKDMADAEAKASEEPSFKTPADDDDDIPF